MRIYSDYPLRRAAQIAVDAIVLVAIALSVWLGTVVHGLVLGLAEAGRSLEDAGGAFRDTMRDAGDALGDVPLIGGGIRSPFDAASDAGATLADAGTAQQELVAQLALVLGVITAGIPIAALLWTWLRRRIAFAIRATRAAALARTPDGVDVLALRALVGADRRRLLDLGPGSVDGWRSGEPAAIRRLADLELAGAGIRLR